MYINLLKELNNLKNNSIIDYERNNDNQSNIWISQSSCTIISTPKNVTEGNYKEAIFNLVKIRKQIFY